MGILSMIKSIRKILRGWLGVKDIYYIQGIMPSLVEGYLLGMANSTDIVIDVEPISSGSIIEISDCKYLVIGCALRIVKHD